MLEFNNKESIKFTVDSIEKTVTVNEEEIKLTTKEFLIFEYLFERRGQLCSRKTMLKEIFGYHEEAETRIIDVYVKYLRSNTNNVMENLQL